MKFRLFYLPLIQYIKRLSHPDKSIQLSALINLLENIQAHRDIFPLYNSILYGYLAHLPPYEYVNHRILIEQSLFVSTRRLQHAFTIVHIFKKNGIHPLVLEYLIEKINGKSLIAIQNEILTNNKICKVAYCKKGYDNDKLLKYATLFFADLDVPCRVHVLHGIMRNLANKNPELDAAGIDDQIIALRYLANTFNDEVFRINCAKLLVKLFSINLAFEKRKYVDIRIADLIIKLAGADFFSQLIQSGESGVYNPIELLLYLKKTCQLPAGKLLCLNNFDHFAYQLVTRSVLNEEGLELVLFYIGRNRNLAESLSRLFRIRFNSAENILEMISCYSVAMIIRSTEDSELWNKLYNSIIKQFAVGKFDIQWVYALNLSDEESHQLECKFIETKPCLTAYEWKMILKYTSSSEHKDLAAQHLQNIKTDNPRASNEMKKKQDPDILISKITNHYNTPHCSAFDHDYWFVKRVKKISARHALIKDKFVNPCLPVIIERINETLYKNDKKKSYQEAQMRDLLNEIFALSAHNFHEFVLGIIARKNCSAINKITQALVIMHANLPSKFIKDYVEKLYGYLINIKTDSKTTQDNARYPTEFLILSCGHLSIEQITALTTLDNEFTPLLFFLRDSVNIARS